MAVELAPITAADVPDVAAFLNANHNSRVSPAAWADAVRVPWNVDAPNHGFLLRADGHVTGAYLAYYADRTIGGETVRFCNLGAWCVAAAHRAQGFRLLRALLAQRDYHFTDLSPSGNVIELNRRLRFTDLDTTTALIPNTPALLSRRDVRVTAEPLALRSVLAGADYDIYRDHEHAAAAHHVLLTTGEGSCYVIYRRDRRKGVRAFASVLHVDNPALFRTHGWRLGPYLLRRHGAAATLVELRVVGGRPDRSFVLSGSRPKMFKSSTLSADQIDDLYSELTCLEW